MANYIWLFVVTGLYVYFTLKLWNIPEEAIHFLEYGLLSLFLYKALSHHIRNNSIYFTATIFALFIGTFDEIVQWIIPQRVWNFHDVWLNALSGGLFQLAIWKVVTPEIISEKINFKSIRIFTSFLTSYLILLSLCILNTPQHVASYSKRIPWLSFLQKEEPMSEFGYKYNDKDVGIFYSRLSPKKLRDTDMHQGEEYAQMLNNSINQDYEQFLRKYTPIANPFLHELRVHVFRRDAYYEKALKTTNLKEKQEFYFIAYKENLILHKYFTKTTTKSIFRWHDNKIEKSQAIMDKNRKYESPVSANLFTALSERTTWISILVLLSLLMLINLVLPFVRITASY